jgi:D-ribose pyranase
MRKTGTLNARLAYIMTQLGHTDQLVICDSGLPIPESAEVIDLALKRGIPRFTDVLDIILEELCVEQALIANEMESTNPTVHSHVRKALNGIAITKVSHEEFKQRTREGGNVVFVRSGEVTPYANIILVAGVDFA